MGKAVENRMKKLVKQIEAAGFKAEKKKMLGQNDLPSFKKTLCDGENLELFARANTIAIFNEVWLDLFVCLESNRYPEELLLKSSSTKVKPEELEDESFFQGQVKSLLGSAAKELVFLAEGAARPSIEGLF